MKVLIPIFHGHTSRNILRTKILSTLLEGGATVVLVVPAVKKDWYEKEFGSEKVLVEAAPVIKFSKLDRAFRFFYYYFVDTSTVRILRGEEFLYTGRPVRYWWSRFLTYIFGHSRILRQVVRFFDEFLVKDYLFAPIFDKHNPDIVFIPSITSDDEGLVLRQAKQRGIKTVGMVRSWDNITVNKGNIRVAPDKLIVHTAIMKQEAWDYCDYPGEKVVVVGMPHFDYFLDEPMSRGEFFRKLHLDPDKKIIFLALIGISAGNLDNYIVGVLEKFIKETPELNNFQLIVRPHPNENKPIDYADPSITKVNMPDMMSFPGLGLGMREFSKEDLDTYKADIYYSDIVVNVQGTNSIDASAFDKPVINVNFDEVPNKAYYKSVKRLYDYHHYLPILRSGGIRLANTEEELRKYLLEYAENPHIDAEGRKRIIEEQAPMFDGRASERTAQAILSV